MSSPRFASLAVCSPSVADRAARVDARFHAPFTTEAAFLAAEAEEAEWNGHCATVRHAIEREADRRRYDAALAAEAARRADPRVPVELYCTVA